MISMDFGELMSKVFLDCGIDNLTTQYCLARLSKEGPSFWTITLPAFSKFVLRSIEVGYLLPKSDFTFIEWRGTFPRYFRGLIRQMFSWDGKLKKYVVREDFDALALWQLRQCTEYVFKLELELPKAKKQAQDFQSEIKFIQTEQALDSGLDNRFIDQVHDTFLELYPELLVEASVPFDRHQANAGPGTFSGCTTGGTNPWGRVYPTELPFLQRANDLGNFIVEAGGGCLSPSDVVSRINEIKSPTGTYRWYARKDVDYGYHGDYEHFKKQLTPPLSWCEPYRGDLQDPDYSEVLFVPKDSRGPRTIVREPYARLRCTSVYFKWLTTELEKASDGRINFRVQDTNREVARVASITRDYATLDLKDASDRVRLDVCKRVFAASPAIMYFLNRRTSVAKLPTQGFITLKKVAGMGSYLTFPTMALLIHVAIVRAVFNRYGGMLTQTEIASKVFVYGDDIALPTGWAADAIVGLEKVGLLVNTDKSYIRSYFRESCGGDYYRGQDVSPVRLKMASCGVTYKKGRLIASGQKRHQFYLSVERHARELVKNGMVNTSEWLYRRLERYLGPLPQGSGDNPYLCRYSSLPVPYEIDSCGNSKKVTVWACVPSVRKKDPGLDLNQALSRNLYRNTESGDIPLVTDQCSPSRFGGISPWDIPRTVVMVRRTVRSFALAG